MFSGKSLLSLVVVTLAALVVPLLGVTSASAAPERRLAKKTADLSRVAGFPTSTEPGRRIARATMVIHYHENGTADLDVDVTLVDSAGGGQLQYGVGTTNGSGECNLTHGDTRSTWSGATEYSDWVSLPVNRVFNCASV